MGNRAHRNIYQKIRFTLCTAKRYLATALLPLLTMLAILTVTPVWADSVIATIPIDTSPFAIAVNPVTNKIYVANISSNNVTVIDGVTHSTTTVAVGLLPRKIAVNPVTNKIYVVNTNSGTVTVIDGATNTTTTVALAEGIGTSPDSIAVNPVTNKIYVVHFYSATVTVIDGATNSVSAVTVGSMPVHVAVNPVTNKIYVADYWSNTITVIDGTTNSTSTVMVESRPFSIAVNPVTDKIYVAHMLSGNIAVIDGNSNTTTMIAADGARAIAVNPITNKIYAAREVNQFMSGAATIIDGATNSITTVAVGAFPSDIAVNPVTNKIYVTNTMSNSVTVIDGATNSTSTVTVGSDPSPIAVNSTTNRVYVGNHNSGNVSVIAPTTLTSVTVTPPNPTINVGQTQQFTATGMFSDGTSRAFIGSDDIWVGKASMPTPRSHYAMGVVNGTLYAVGGLNGAGFPLATMEAYDPATNTWTTKASMLTPRYSLSAGVVNGTLYAVGGYNSVNGYLTTVEAYDPVTDTWTTKASMPTNRANLVAAVVNGTLYAMGGANSLYYLTTVEAYDPATNTWATKASMSTPRYVFSAGVVNGTLYVAGGLSYTSFGRTLAAVEAYDPATNTWTSKAPMSTPRESSALGVINGMLYAVGGYNSVNGYLTTVEAYDPATNTWTPKASMSTARAGHGAGVVNGTLYAVGGSNSSGYLATVEAYTPPEVIWSSSNTSVATINPTGLVTGHYLGTSTITATSGSISGSTTLLVVSPNRPPSACAGPDQIIGAISPAGAAVSMNGACSTDPDGDALSYIWSGPFGSVSGMNPTVNLPLGMHTLTLTVSDGLVSATDNVVITVRDTTAPVIAAHADVTAEATSAAGAIVSYTSPATSDAVYGAGVANCAPASGTTFALGNSTVTCSATDAHGNVAAATSFVVHVADTTAPTITAPANITDEATSATGAVVNYSLAIATDAVSIPTVTCSPLSGSTFPLGTTTITCTATDAAGNSSSATFSVTVQDTTPPVISINQLPLANANGWNNSNVTVSFSATDAVSTPTCSVNSVTLTAEGSAQVVSTTCTDAAGNSASASHTVNIDKTAPVVTGSRTPAANADGWNNTDVTAHFTATDGLSGVEGSAVADVVVASEGMGQTASTSFTDLAGNTGSATVSNINIDKTAPVLTMPSLAGSYGLNSSLTLTFAAADALSQIATQSATLNGNPVSSGSIVALTQLGNNTFVLTATDKAGNSVTETRQFSVSYTFGGFLSPLAGSRTTFHLGSVIPVKFDLFDANGVAVSSAVAHLSLQQYSGDEPVGDPIDATPASGADSGNLFRYSGGHYMYNLSTKPFSAGIWRIQATLDDGTVRTIEIGLSSK